MGSTMTSERFEKNYRNQQKLKCGLRVKWEEFRILWGRQELNRYKANYNNTSGDGKTSCSYCGLYTEDENTFTLTAMLPKHSGRTHLSGMKVLLVCLRLYC